MSSERCAISAFWTKPPGAEHLGEYRKPSHRGERDSSKPPLCSGRTHRHRDAHLNVAAACTPALPQLCLSSNINVHPSAASDLRQSQHQRRTSRYIGKVVCAMYVRV